MSNLGLQPNGRNRNVCHVKNEKVRTAHPHLTNAFKKFHKPTLIQSTATTSADSVEHKLSSETNCRLAGQEI
jgi:hypothetical protein